MIVKIDSSICEALTDNKNFLVMNALEDICRLRMDGYIVVDVTKKIANEFKQSERLGDLQKRIFSMIAEEITFHSEILSQIEQRIVLFHKVIKDDVTHNDVILSIDILNYIKVSPQKTILTKPLLILENYTDSVIYKKIATWYLKEKELPSNIHINFEVIHGGGDTSSDVCKHHQSLGNLVFSICDSDRKSPYCPIGQTARKMENVFHQLKLEHCFLLLDVHEVENLIPLNVLEATANLSQKSTIEFLKHVENHLSEGYLFYDLKEGFNYEFVYVSQEQRSKYWNDIYQSYGCPDYAAYKAQLEVDETKHKFKFFSRLSSMLPHARENLSSNSVVVHEQEALEKEWQKIGSWLTKFFISYGTMRV